MKKVLLYGLMSCATVFGFTSCNDNNDQLTDTRVTNYILLNIKGDPVVYVDANTTYEDAGCTAELAGEDVSSQVIVTNPVNTSEVGPYTVLYKATNADGFSATASRKVYVGTHISGTVAEGTFRKTAKGVETPYSGFEIDMLTDNNGKFWIEDLMGGYYEQRAGYGDRYAMNGFLKVNDDGTVDMVGGGDVVGWGDAYSGFRDGKFDPATNTLSYTVVYAEMDFNVTLTIN